MKKSTATLKNDSKKHLAVSIQFSEDEIEVGKLILDKKLVHFKYNDDFLKLNMNLSPIRVQFDNSIQIANPTPFKGLFGLFDDSLPDEWGVLLLNRALEKKGETLGDINILDQLAYIGDTGRGALIYRPSIENGANFSKKIDIDHLKDSINQVIKGESMDVIDELMHLGGSSGGARPKANVGYNPKTNELMHVHTTLPTGFEHWIIKFPNAEDPKDIANIEYAYYKMALGANIKMSECRLLESKTGQQVFATKRFDRIGNHRIHMHSMAGLTYDNFKRSSIDYGHIIDMAYRIEKSASARKKVLRLAAFNLYSHNRDDHSKNFSWLMDSSGNWTLAPAYDLTYSSTVIDEHSTRIDGEGANPGRKHILSLAEEFSISKPNDIIEEVQDSLSKWPSIAEECGVSTDSIDRIQAKFKELND